jgi:S-disulfanyl-L-cysteine oxidoreductase SoxD
MSRLPERLKVLLRLGALAIAFAASAQAQDRPRYGIGRAPSAEEIAAWDIDVRPDGHGLRKGRGTVARGQELYDAQCASCHGTFGESNRYMAIAGGVRPGDLKAGRASALTSADVTRTLGMKLNYATTLFDYIYRAMPWTNPQSLSVDDTYAITAYVLHLNEIVPADFELSDRNILQVQMPNRNGMTTAHGLVSVNGKPDVQGSACMRNCAEAVTVTSEMPHYARNQSGNLAEQKRPLGPTRGIDTSMNEVAKGDARPTAAVQAALADPKALVIRNACTACHGLNNRIVGPGFNEVAARYKGRADAEAYLVQKIRSGGDGVWGTVPMPPQSTLKEEEALLIARWIAAGAR